MMRDSVEIGNASLGGMVELNCDCERGKQDGSNDEVISNGEKLWSLKTIDDGLDERENCAKDHSGKCMDVYCLGQKGVIMRNGDFMRLVGKIRIRYITARTVASDG
jgi:hypothetical protein